MDKRPWFLLCVVWLLSGLALAQVSTADKAAAEALFDRGLVLMREGKLEEACARLEQSLAIEHGIGTMLYLAECYEKSGRTASAWALFREAASQAQAAGQLERAAAGRQRAERIEPTLARLTLDVPESARSPGLELRRNGSPVPAGVWGLALPVDPGEQRIEARAPGRLPFTQVVAVDKGPSSARLEVPALQPDPGAVAATSAEPAEPSAIAATRPASELSTSEPTFAPEQRASVPERSALQRAGLGMAISGALLAVVGGGFGIRAKKKNDEAKDLGCRGKECFGLEGDEGVDRTNEALTAATLSSVGVGVGAGLLAAGLTMYFVAPSRETRVSAAFDKQHAVVSLGGAF